jgi:hypothetical protein
MTLPDLAFEPKCRNDINAFSMSYAAMAGPVVPPQYNDSLVSLRLPNLRLRAWLTIKMLPL